MDLIKNASLVIPYLHQDGMRVQKKKMITMEILFFLLCEMYRIHIVLKKTIRIT